MTQTEDSCSSSCSLRGRGTLPSLIPVPSRRPKRPGSSQRLSRAQEEPTQAPTRASRLIRRSSVPDVSPPRAMPTPRRASETDAAPRAPRQRDLKRLQELVCRLKPQRKSFMAGSGSTPPVYPDRNTTRHSAWNMPVRQNTSLQPLEHSKEAKNAQKIRAVRRQARERSAASLSPRGEHSTLPKASVVPPIAPAASGIPPPRVSKPKPQGAGAAGGGSGRDIKGFMAVARSKSELGSQLGMSGDSLEGGRRSGSLDEEGFDSIPDDDECITAMMSTVANDQSFSDWLDRPPGTQEIRPGTPQDGVRLASIDSDYTEVPGQKEAVEDSLRAPARAQSVLDPIRVQGGGEAQRAHSVIEAARAGFTPSLRTLKEKIKANGEKTHRGRRTRLEPLSKPL